MKTNRQIEVFLFKRATAGILFLMLKRNAQKGGFWQPVTGGVEEGELDIEAALREIGEETGLTPQGSLLDTGYSFTFEQDEKTLYEQVFGIEVFEQDEITLSSEHTDLAWVSFQEALDNYLKWPNNKEGLKALRNIMESTDNA